MEDQQKKYTIGIFVTLALMLIWIPVAVLLTGGREISDFTGKDYGIFIGLIISECTAVLVMSFFCEKLGSLNQKDASRPVSRTRQGKIAQRRGIFLYVAALVFATGTYSAGIGAGTILSEDVKHAFARLAIACAAIPVLLFFVNLFLSKRMEHKFRHMRAEAMMQYILSHRESAEKTATQKLTFLRRWRHLTDLYALLFLFCGVDMAFSVGTTGNAEVPTLFATLAAAFFIQCAFSRIRFPMPKAVFEDDKTYVSATEFPALYALAHRAAKTIGQDMDIRISIQPDNNAGIARVGNICSVELGAILLSVCAQEEIYNILLHEFAHMKNERRSVQKERQYNYWIESGGNPHILDAISHVLFSYPEMMYSIQYSLYLYASTVSNETAADQAMRDYGDPRIAASALIKLHYYTLFNWEKGTYDTDCKYADESVDDRYLRKEVDAFKQAITHRANAWNRCIDAEIMSRDASHPTLKMRLNSLEIKDYPLIEPADTPIYRAECTKALSYIQGLVCEHQKKNYTEYREEYYLQPKQQVDTWEHAGRPLTAEGYADIVTALRALGRISDAITLCDRAINELSGAARNYAYFIKACYLLHKYDNRGIDLMYLAVENNSNYIEEGMNILGEYCCLTGNQQALDTYRKKAVLLAQKQLDAKELDALHRHDTLTVEHLPTGMLEEILTYIHTIDGGSIQKIYLVRKTISDTVYTSAFIIRFTEDTEIDTKWEVLHKIFRCLDSDYEHQFSLFDYDDVKKIRVETIPGSCVFSAQM